MSFVVPLSSCVRDTLAPYNLGPRMNGWMDEWMDGWMTSMWGAGLWVEAFLLFRLQHRSGLAGVWNLDPNWVLVWVFFFFFFFHTGLILGTYMVFKKKLFIHRVNAYYHFKIFHQSPIQQYRKLRFKIWNLTWQLWKIKSNGIIFPSLLFHFTFVRSSYLNNSPKTY